MRLFKVTTVFVFLLIYCFQAVAQEASTISYQGSLEVSGSAAQGSYTITATLYADEAGSKSVWSGKYSTVINNGIFNLQLGSGQHVLPRSLPASLWLGIRVGEEAELKPYTKIASVPSALQAKALEGGAVTSINGKQGDILLKAGPGTLLEDDGKTITISALLASKQEPQAASDVSKGGTGRGQFTPFSIITGGVTGTGALQEVLPGHKGEFLVCKGQDSLPAWQPFPIGILPDGSLTRFGAVYATGGSIIKSTPALTDGQVMIGVNGSDPIATATPTFQKVQSNSTIESDAPNTLTTKDYVDSRTRYAFKSNSSYSLHSLVSDPDLVIQLESNSTYLIEAWLPFAPQCNVNVTSSFGWSEQFNIVYAFSTPAGANIIYGNVGGGYMQSPPAFNYLQLNAVNLGSNLYSASTSWPPYGNPPIYSANTLSGVVKTGANAGPLQLQHAWGVQGFGATVTFSTISFSPLGYLKATKVQ
jgi:hypothetical protein